MLSDEEFPEDWEGYDRIHPSEVEEGMRVLALYDANYGGHVVRRGEVLDIRTDDSTGQYDDFREIVIDCGDDRNTHVRGGRFAGRVYTYDLFLPPGSRHTPLGNLLAMYRDKDAN